MLPDLTKVEFDAASEFHMLRHYSNLSPQVMDQLSRHGYSMEQIEDELSLPGSRFHREFADSIPTLLDRLSESEIKMDEGINENIILTCTFQDQDWRYGVGVLSVVPLSAIKETERQKIFKKQNRSTLLWHLEVEKLPGSSVCSLILRPDSGRFKWITCFPGFAALPLPSVGMPADLFQKCSAFWDAHVFLILKN